MVKVTTDNQGSLNIKVRNSDGRIEPAQILIVAQSGEGKSLAEEGFVDQLHREGCTIVYLSDGFKGKEEIAFGEFGIQDIAKYHKRLLNRYGIPERVMKVKKYTPFTFNLPKNKLMPDYQPFTIPIKSLGATEFSMLLGTENDSETIKLLMKSLNGLTKEEGLLDFLYNLRDMTKGEIKSNRDNLFLDISSGNIKSLQEIKRSFFAFETEYFLTKEKSPLNLDFKKLVNDQESIHFFSTRFIKEEKMKALVLLIVLNGIINASEYKKYPLVIVLPEARKVLPDSLVGFNKYLAQAFTYALSTIRNRDGGGFLSILSTQNWSDMSEAVRNTATLTLFGKISTQDIEKLTKVYSYSKATRDKLANMPRGKFIVLGKESAEPITIFPGGFCHAEPEFSFDEMFSKYYKERMVMFNEHIDLMRTIVKEEEDRIRERVEREQNREREIIKKKMEMREAQNKPNKEIIKTKERELKDQERLKELEIIINLRNKGMNFAEVGKALGISRDTARRRHEDAVRILNPKIETPVENTQTE
jgi:hypothetical protein